jgi:hypothetical protein
LKLPLPLLPTEQEQGNRVVHNLANRRIDQ